MRASVLLIACLCFAAVFAPGLPAGEAKPDSAGQQTLQHAILVNVNSRKITRHDLDDMGVLLFTINYPDRKMEEVTESEIDQLSTSALRELIVLNLVEDEEEKINSDKDEKNNVVLKSEDVMQEAKDLGIEKLLAKPLTLRFARYQRVFRYFIFQSTGTFQPSPRQIANFYRDNLNSVFTTERMVRVRHIFIPEDHSAPQISKKQAQLLYDELLKRPVDKRLAIFPKMAEEFSQGRFREQGGLIDVGRDAYFPQSHEFRMPDGSTFFPEAMLRGIRALNNAGDVQLTKSDDGWHLLLLDDIKGGIQVPQQKMRKNIEDFLVQEAMDRAKLVWLERKVKTSNIIWHDGDPFPRDKILLGIDPAQKLAFLRMRIERQLAAKKAPSRAAPATDEAATVQP